MYKYIKFTIVLVLLLTAKSYAYIYSDDKSEVLNRIKDGQTYVIVQDVNFPDAAKFLKEMRKVWTLTKGISYITYEEADAKIQPNDSFISIFAKIQLTPRGSYDYGYWLSFWTRKEKLLKKGSPPLKEIVSIDEEDIASVILSNASPIVHKKNYERIEFDRGTSFHNWTPGMIKNDLQRITLNLNNIKENKRSKDSFNKAELAQLSKNTLYVADFGLSHWLFGTGRQSTNDEITEIFKKYEYPINRKTKGKHFTKRIAKQFQI